MSFEVLSDLDVATQKMRRGTKQQEGQSCDDVHGELFVGGNLFLVLTTVISETHPYQSSETFRGADLCHRHTVLVREISYIPASTRSEPLYWVNVKRKMVTSRSGIVKL